VEFRPYRKPFQDFQPNRTGFAQEDVPILQQSARIFKIDADFATLR